VGRLATVKAKKKAEKAERDRIEKAPRKHRNRG
jgi:hypothetical protein